MVGWTDRGKCPCSSGELAENCGRGHDNGSIELSFFLRLKWFDPRLLFNGAELFGDAWNDYRRFPLYSEEVWTPRLIMVDSLRNQFEDFPDTMLAIKDNETVATEGYNAFWSRPGSIAAKCVMDLRLFPFDTQHCSVRFESWIHHAGFIDMVVMNSGAVDYDELAQDGEDFKLVDVNLIASNVQYSTDETPGFSTMTLRLTIQRYAFYYVVHSLLPEIVLVCLCALTPWLAVKPEHSGGGERMAFALSLLLTIFANMLFAADRRPLLKSDVWLDQFQSWCIALAVLPIMETAFIMWIHRHHLSTDVVKRISSRKHVGIPRFRRDLSKNADEVAQRAWEFALAVDVAFRHCYPVLILVVFSYKLSSVDIHNFFLTESAAALAAITVMINIVLLGISFFVFVMLVVTLSRRLDPCCRRVHPAFEQDEEVAVPDETSDEEGDSGRS